MVQGDKTKQYEGVSEIFEGVFHMFQREQAEQCERGFAILTEVRIVLGVKADWIFVGLGNRSESEIL